MKSFILLLVSLYCTLHDISAIEKIDTLDLSIEITDSTYKARYKNVIDDLTLFVSQTSIYRGEISNAWHNGIYEKKYNGKNVKDFNEALSKYFEDRRATSDYWRYLSQQKIIKSEIKSLNKYPKDLEIAFNEMLDLGIMIDEFFNAVIDPGGSYNSYTAYTRDLEQKIRRKLYELEMRYTD